MAEEAKRERWKPVPKFEGQYEVSDLGRVRSFRRNSGGVLLRPGLTAQGYPSVVLGRYNTRLVHRLVADAFLGACPPGNEVRHKDGRRDNPRLSNLEYGTRADNVADAKRHGTHWIGLLKKLKISLEERETIRELRRAGFTLAHLAARFKVSEATILKVCRRGHAIIY